MRARRQNKTQGIESQSLGRVTLHGDTLGQPPDPLSDHYWKKSRKTTRQELVRVMETELCISLAINYEIYTIIVLDKNKHLTTSSRFESLID